MAGMPMHVLPLRFSKANGILPVPRVARFPVMKYGRFCLSVHPSQGPTNVSI